MSNVIYGTVTGYDTVGETVNGDPITEVRIDPANGSEPTIRRVSHGAPLAYDVDSHREDGAPRAYVLTDAGRVSHDDWLVTGAYRRLFRYFPRGSEAVTVLTHVSASGMSRRFRVLAVDSTHSGEGSVPRVEDVTLSVARVLGSPTTERGEVRVRGAGMDMGLHTVYTLAWKLYGDGYAINHRGL